MNKYIVKNCPNCNADEYQCEISTGGIYFSNPCKDSDCIIKQIIEKLKMLQVLNIGLINEIIDMLKIEDVQDAG